MTNKKFLSKTVGVQSTVRRGTVMMKQPGFSLTKDWEIAISHSYKGTTKHHNRIVSNIAQLRWILVHHPFDVKKSIIYSWHSLHLLAFSWASVKKFSTGWVLHLRVLSINPMPLINLDKNILLLYWLNKALWRH